MDRMAVSKQRHVKFRKKAKSTCNDHAEIDAGKYHPGMAPSL